MKAFAFFRPELSIYYKNSMNQFQVRLRWKILYCCETCLSAVICKPNINTGERYKGLGRNL